MPRVTILRANPSGRLKQNGRHSTPTYRVEFVAVNQSGKRYNDKQIWRKEYGRPSEAALTRFVYGFEDSTLPGYVNEHVGVTRVSSARIVRQSDGSAVVEYTAPMFGTRDMKRYPIKAAKRNAPGRRVVAGKRNPPASRVAATLSTRAVELRYLHREDKGQAYKHAFSRGVTVQLLTDGSVRLFRPDGRPLWKQFED